MRMTPYFFTTLVVGSLACGIEVSDRPNPIESSGAGSSESTTPTTGTGGSSSTELDASTTDTTTSAQTAASSDDSETTAAEPSMCGNGIVEGDEECDDDFDGNGENQACSNFCQKARCGDGHVQPAVGEACDDGAENVPVAGYGQCSSDCVRGPYCGDGVVQPDGGEQCDVGELRGELENCTVVCTYESRFVFLSSVAFDGNLGGTAGADKHCNELVADGSGLTGTYRAWLLVDGQSLAARFPEYSGATLPWNFTDVAGNVLASSFEQLLAVGPASPIVYSEMGDALPKQLVWTGITNQGLAAGGDCAQWTSAEGTPALVGHSGYDPDTGPEAQQWHDERRWTDAAGLKIFCNLKYRLYCVQVGD